MPERDPARRRGRALSVAALGVLLVGMLVGALRGEEGAGVVQGLLLLGIGLAVAGAVLMAVGRRREERS